MKILLVNPPFLGKFSRSSRSPAVAKGGTIYFPIWLAYAAGVLEKAGHEVMLVDAPARGISKTELLKIAMRFRPDMIVCDTSTPSIYSDAETLIELKRAAKAFGVLVGTHPSALPKETMEISKEIDAVARHEYDYILRDLAKELEKEKPNLANVKGLTYRKGKKVVSNKDMPLIENLDELPFVSEVYKKHLNIRDYFYSANLYPEVTIISGRGCPYKCKFCVLPQVMNGRTYRPRSVKNVADEFEYIKKEFPEVKEVFIEDDTLTADKERVREFSEELLKRGIKITWSCNARADVDLETLQAMKKAGCRLLCVGFESGNQQILNNICKGTKVSVIRQFMKDTKKAGILVHGCFLLGNQGETKETIMETIEFAKELNPDTAQFFPIMVYPGTETYAWAEKNGFITTQNFREWLDAEGNHNCVLSRPGLTNDELVALCDEGRKQFYLRPSFIGNKALQSVTSPHEAKRILKSAKTFYKYLFKGN